MALRIGWIVEQDKYVCTSCTHLHLLRADLLLHAVEHGGVYVDTVLITRHLKLGAKGLDLFAILL